VSPLDPELIAFLQPLKEQIAEQSELIKNLQATIYSLQETVKAKDAELAELRRMLFGQKSERMPSVESELKKRRSPRQKQSDKATTQKKRKANRKKKEELFTEDIIRETEDELVCPLCNGTDFKDLPPEESYEYEYIPAKFIRRRYIRKKKACLCGGHIVLAPGPNRVSEGVQYGSGLHAHIVVSKCSDSLPLYRQAKIFSRAGLSICRSTLGDMFHRSASLLEPLHKRMLEIIAKERYVRADETPQPVLDKEKTRKGYMWNFNTDILVAYVFSPNRSGDTPEKVLGNSTGLLQVDAFSGYNKVTTPKGRKRVGCWAHLRRKFFDARNLAPDECQHALDTILNLYEVEYSAAEQNVLGTEKHLAMRKTKSKKITNKLKSWLEKQKKIFPPRSKMGQAIGYALNQWKTLIVFLDDAKLHLDNNMSERMLRLIALGRKNFLFVGNNGAGDNLAVLQSLVSTALLNDVNPQEYLADVLLRIQTHPQSKIDELLPHRWKKLDPD
jgi:transposase